METKVNILKLKSLNTKNPKNILDYITINKKANEGLSIPIKSNL